MGKLSQQQLPVVQPQRGGGGAQGQRCSIGLSRIAKELNFKCVLVLLLSLALSVYALYSVLPLHSKQSGFDANESIKLSATAQVYFRLQKPASELIPNIPELEHEIFDEIGIPSTKVAILSVHQAGTSNWTDVVVGVLPNPLNVSVDPALLSLLKLTLVELFLQESNLTLTNTTFGQPFSFNILKFPGGITLFPKRYPIVQIPEILFNFTLNNSIDEIKENFVVLNGQLRLGLHLMPDENVYIQVTNKDGSTRDPPVVVEASITSYSGNLLPQRLKQLAQIITGSSQKNLGLDNSVFGKVKEVILSSCLNHSLHALPPSPSPSPSSSPSPSPSSSPYPSPEPIWDSGPSLSPAPLSQADPPAPANFRHLAPSSDCGTAAPSDASPALAPSLEYYSPRSPSIRNSPAPSVMHKSPNHRSPISPSFSPMAHTYPVPSLPPSKSPKSEVPLGPSPLPSVSYGSSHGWNNGNGKNLVSPPGVLPPISASSSSSLQGSLYKIWWICLLELLLFRLSFHVG